MFSGLFPENRAVYEIMSKNNVGPDTLQMTKWRVQDIYGCKNTLRICNIYNFSLQQSLH